MRDVYPTMKQWAKAGRRFALCRVVKTWGSAPRAPGSALLVSEDGQVAGSVSGGCIEGAVIQEALQTLEDGQRRLCHYGVTSQTAWSVGLSCGGEIEVLVQPFDPSAILEARWLEGLASGNQMTVTTSLEGTGQDLEVGEGWEKSTEVMEREGERAFQHVISSPARLLLIGGADIAVHLTLLASGMDFEVTVVDPRAVFTEQDRFPVRPDRILTAWPQEVLDAFAPDQETYAVLLTHDPKIDDPALQRLLRSPVRYIGALGGRKTQRSRRKRMIAAGFSEEDLDRIRGPVGLRIGAVTPAEIAISILAEIVAVRRGGAV